MKAFNDFLDCRCCLKNALNMAKRNWVKNLSGGRQKLLVHIRSVDDLLFDYERQFMRFGEARSKEQDEQKLNGSIAKSASWLNRPVNPLSLLPLTESEQRLVLDLQSA